MFDGDPNPPILYSSNVLHVAKTEYQKHKYLHEDPIQSLVIMSETKHVGRIPRIGQLPFFVYYWTAEQVRTYKKIHKLYGGISISLDATGLSVKNIQRPFSDKKRSIFLYLICMNSPEGQFSIGQMLSERHTTKDIIGFLLEWISEFLIYPREVICDESRALLNACSTVFNNSPKIEEYANMFHDNIQDIKVRIRIDIAHFICKYNKLLKGLPKVVRVFYLASIGQLAISRSLKEAKKILRGIFILCNSEFNSDKCKEKYTFLKQKITGKQ